VTVLQYPLVFDGIINVITADLVEDVGTFVILHVKLPDTLDNKIVEAVAE
jgi:hypothetical protein